ncbi:hypothetical protein CONCODRAFT_86926 [Conidiobolus coronatus NRRL 28638]|uniref:Uncharacterized protein n=1 Tax=Conidiobolus coronatus (strain ATCC 28846 / CBS 209.66 / NRRL 28638) TaxID=796925 RepID=A0A137NXI6_CONC2|nr:hypothetical protein CONCODRAFT_86926 [Conidiobolus coronatus NRRL 28638]|eukprot:KXN67495.1 hypothetical protein CONCODRAFT_86926 [Conidiobolus coronatus NRRL 28638]
MSLKQIKKPELKVESILEDLANNDKFTDFEKLINLLGEKQSSEICNELNISKTREIESAIENYEDLVKFRSIHNNSADNINLNQLNFITKRLGRIKETLIKGFIELLDPKASK